MDVIVDPPAEQYATFPHQGIVSGYGFDIDLMKRSMDVGAGPENVKKARWNNGQGVDPSSDARYSNYGYGPGANQALYATGMNQNIGLNNMGLTLNGQNGLSINTMNGAQGQMQSSGSASGMPPSPIGGAGQAYLNGLSMAANGFGYGNGMGMGMGMGMNGLNNMGLMGMNGMGMGFGMNGMGMGTQGYAFSPAAATFQQAGQRPNQLSVPGTTNNFNVAAAAAAAAANNQTGRTVYVGNLPADASVDELLNLVRFGPLESVRVLPEKSCVFISFLDGATAAAFHADASVKKLALHGQELKIGWGKPSPVPSQVMLSIQQSNASRNVYLGGLDENMTEEQLRDDLSRFGLIDQVKIVRDKNIGFVHFLSISVATKVVATLPTEPAWAGKRVNYGKDRCAYVPKSQQTQGNAMATAAATVGLTGFTPFSPLANAGGFGLGMPGFDSPTSPAFAMAAAAAAAAGSQMNRTVYLGNIHPETTTEDLCNAIRGGVLQSIRYMQDKHIAFVTFVDATSAFTFYQVATYQGMTLNNRRLKIGWGKNSGPLPPALAIAVHSGATRNVYIGNIEDFENFSEEKLRRDFEEFGDIELINFLKEKGAAFINFTNIASAIKAIDAVKNREPYSGLRVSYGKDRCANAPRTQSAVRPRGNGGHSPSAATMDGDDLARSPSIRVDNIENDE
ncbi:RNA-binding protein Nrd1 (negative regulator of differentiation), related protein, putative [Rhizoctonia solani AG-3 Rhs1AP]|uniref:RNA-binding protein Nrd1 (Negative regulator of differentiation), related protein, putative n=2 Tax=Rhizoctonia solani AG-3 TaxID=1086053 RepID=X8JFD5_9AGAM|nr:RNA-binding protein Nrd1 (negative regulator of differentiation), related protein, putative [Rhizoctonia solani AG-3 Rhs1AP]KEP48516.1 putative RNA-binding protein Nrd1 (negative regulator of differentiation), related protein [Rhizoctonia solani 123E]